MLCIGVEGLFGCMLLYLFDAMIDILDADFLHDESWVFLNEPSLLQHSHCFFVLGQGSYFSLGPIECAILLFNEVLTDIGEDLA